MPIPDLHCSTEDKEFRARLHAYDKFATKAYDALSWQDMDALVELCALPGDVDESGNTMVRADGSGYGDMTARQVYAQFFRQFITSLQEKGGTQNMTLVRVGKPIGLMSSESDFVGNMFLIVSLSGEQMAIEVGSSMLTANRGRVIIDGNPFMLQPLSYYEEMIQIF